MLACLKGHLDVVQFLVHEGVDLNAKTSFVSIFSLYV